MSQRTFYAAKVNIHGNIFSPNLNELISIHIPRVILTPDKIIKKRKWNWSFTDTERKTVQDRDLIFGNVTKSSFQQQKIKMGSKTVKQKSLHELANTSFFVYDIKNEILIHESTSSIGHAEFRDMFTALLSRDEYVGEVIIKPIPIPQIIRQEIANIEKITSIHFHIIHPNPGKKQFDIYQDLIDEHNLKELELTMKNEDGLEIATTTESDTNVESDLKFKDNIEKGIDLVEAGYGDIEVKGFREVIVQGKRKKKPVRRNKSFSSKRSLRYIKTNENDNKLMNKLVSFINSVANKII